LAIITPPSTIQWAELSTFKLQRAGLTLRSRYTGRRQSVSFPFALWVIEGKLVKVDGLEAGRWRSFLVQLSGQDNTFRLPVPGHSGPASGFNAGGTGADTTTTLTSRPAGSSSVVVGNWTATGNGVPLVAEGDYVTVNDELKVVTAGALTAAGGATINFKPPLRRFAASGSAVAILRPTVMVQAQDDDVAGWGLSRPVQHTIQLKLMEAFD